MAGAFLFPCAVAIAGDGVTSANTGEHDETRTSRFAVRSFALCFTQSAENDVRWGRGIIGVIKRDGAGEDALD
jgi:hypothetical protein